MPSNSLSDAIREAYASAQSDLIYLDTLQVSHPTVGDFYIVADREDHLLGLETGVYQNFTASGFRFILPSAGRNGVQELTVAIDNVNRIPSQFVADVLAAPGSEPVTLTYRPYLSTKLDRPQMNPPLVLFLTDIVITAVEITGTATFADLLNRTFLSESYGRRNFPGL